MKKFLISLLLIFSFAFGCTSFQQNFVTQVSTIDALLSGLYEGTTTLKEVIKHGDFGIGTFDKLDGEMIILDGIVYQIKADGKVYQPSHDLTTPFFTVTKFEEPDSSFTFSSTTFKEFEKSSDDLINNKNLFYAIKMSGNFKYVKTRSVPSQTKPYKPLNEVTKNQSVFEKENVSGTTVGFRSPQFASGINVPGYHLHFISDDKTFGGHVLDLSFENCKVEILPLHNFKMLLPESSEFGEADLKKNRADELNKVEK
ncbi:MAG: acetolactate decarboxylase [Ignavibacteriales bacterium]|nr:acetolactate decarboxylase [Ignavibacteriales bacterium]